MASYDSHAPRESEITPPAVYFNRRAFIKSAAMAAAVVGTGGLYRWLTRRPGSGPAGSSAGQQAAATSQPIIATTQPVVGYSPEMIRAFTTDEAKTSFHSITHYNNFYEFTTSKDEVAEAVEGFSTAGWKVQVDGLCAKPATFDMDDILKIAPAEERIYRMRCVEAWSMVIPWVGYPLSRLLDKVQPLGGAKYVAFTTLHDPSRMPGPRDNILQWPYVEGLRMDEAMHPLTLLTTGLYGRALPAQDGAPVRMVIPWKYGFKGIKSIVKISLVADQPPTSWNRYARREYGFYANVNPNHPHPRWSQATEQRIGESGRRKTLLFNGYADQVASLYAGMDLDENF